MLKSSKTNQKELSINGILSVFLFSVYTSDNKTVGVTLHATSAGNTARLQEKILLCSVAVICDTRLYTYTTLCNIDYTNQSAISTRQDKSADSVSFRVQQAG